MRQVRRIFIPKIPPPPVRYGEQSTLECFYNIGRDGKTGLEVSRKPMIRIMGNVYPMDDHDMKECFDLAIRLRDKYRQPDPVRHDNIGRDNWTYGT
jgi:hypothetical protein